MYSSNNSIWYVSPQQIPGSCPQPQITQTFSTIEPPMIIQGATYVLLEENMFSFSFNCEFRHLFFLKVGDFILQNVKTKENTRDLNIIYNNKLFIIEINSITTDRELILEFSITEKDRLGQPNITAYKTILREFKDLFLKKFDLIEKKTCDSCIHGPAFKLTGICKESYTNKDFEE